MSEMRKLIVVALLLLGACSSGPGKTTLIIYSPHGKELLTEFETRFEAQNPSIDVRWLDMGSQDALDRVRSERANPQADLWWGAPSTMFSTAEKEGLLDPYKPSWGDNVDPDARGRNDGWFGTFQTPEVIAFNSKALKREDAPQDWDDLIDPKWRGKFVIRDPLASGTMRAIFEAMILRHMGPDGKPDPGYEWLKKLDANTKEYVANTTLLWQKLGRQEAVLTLWNMPDIELQKTQYQYPFDYVIPKSGTPVLTDAIAIVKGTKHRKEAESFYEFVNSEDSLLVQAEKFYRIPARKDISRDKLPQWMRTLNIPKLEMNWDLVEAKSQEWMEHWDSFIRGASASP
jgi:iron(III) transport system substrate-binding protein